jgi:polyhydroxyalkanoate synthase subunit PhaC
MAPDARAARPAAPHRIGEPSPLIFHLGAALAGYNQALLAAPRADAPEFPWSAHLAEAAAGLGPGLDRLEIARQIGARLSATARGIEIWQSHPYRRVIDEPPTLWRSGSSRLLDYGATPEAVDPEGPPVLVVPSLINRAYILDLAPGRSMLRWLAAQGLRPILLDWGAPGPDEARLGLEEYGTARLLPALEHLRDVTGRPRGTGRILHGRHARRGPRRARARRAGRAGGDRRAVGFRLDPRHRRRRARDDPCRGAGAHRAADQGLGEAFGFVPVSVFQTLFALVSPMQAALKFQKLARLDPDSAAARHFVALEDWLSDGVPMPAPAATNLLVDWQIRNLTATGRWRFLGGTVDPGAIALPALAFCGQSDTIAPPSLSLALPAAIPGARVAQPRTGHVGMIVGSAARALVWRPLASFLAAHAG